MLKQRGLQIISWSFCLAVPWVAGSLVYFAAQERWLMVVASFLLSISMTALGIEGVLRSTLDHLDQRGKQRDLDA